MEVEIVGWALPLTHSENMLSEYQSNGGDSKIAPCMLMSRDNQATGATHLMKLLPPAMLRLLS